MTDLSTSVSDLRAQFEAALAVAASAADLQALRDRFLGRKQGLVTALYAEIGKVPADHDGTSLGPTWFAAVSNGHYSDAELAECEACEGLGVVESRSLPIPVRMSNGAPGNRSCTADFKI